MHRTGATRTDDEVDRMAPVLSTFFVCCCLSAICNFSVPNRVNGELASIVSETMMSGLVCTASQDKELRRGQRARKTNDSEGGTMALFAPEVPSVRGISMREPKDVLPKALRRNRLQSLQVWHLGLNK